MIGQRQVRDPTNANQTHKQNEKSAVPDLIGENSRAAWKYAVGRKYTIIIMTTLCRNVVAYPSKVVRLRRMSNGTVGYRTNERSMKRKAMMPAMPRMSGASTRPELQAYVLPPQVRARTREVTAATKMTLLHKLDMGSGRKSRHAPKDFENDVLEVHLFELFARG